MSPLQVSSTAISVTELEQPHRFNFVVNCYSQLHAGTNQTCGWQHHDNNREQAIATARYHLASKHRPNLNVNTPEAIAELDKFITISDLKKPLPLEPPAKLVVKSSESGAGAKFTGSQAPSIPAKPGAVSVPLSGAPKLELPKVDEKKHEPPKTA